MFFDVGNTLIFPQPNYFEACIRVASADGIYLDPSQFATISQATSDYYAKENKLNTALWSKDNTIHSFFNRFFAQIFKYVIQANKLNISLDNAERWGIAVYNNYRTSSYWEVYDDVFPILRYLKRKNYVLGIYSDWHTGLKSQLANLGLDIFFDHIWTSAQLGISKAENGAYEKVAELSQIIPQQTIFIGDSYNLDYKASKDSGFNSILLDRNNQNSFQDINAINRLDKISRFLGNDKIDRQ